MESIWPAANVQRSVEGGTVNRNGNPKSGRRLAEEILPVARPIGNPTRRLLLRGGRVGEHGGHDFRGRVLADGRPDLANTGPGRRGGATGGRAAARLPPTPKEPAAQEGREAANGPFPVH